MHATDQHQQHQHGMGQQQQQQLHASTRRQALALLALGPMAGAALTGAQPSRASGEVGAEVLQVGPAGGPGSFATISAALEAAPPGARIAIAPGQYRERLVIRTPRVTLEAAAGGAGAGLVEVVWETAEPYQSVVESSAAGVVLRGLVLRHASKSVANNYGVFVTGGDLLLDGCDVSSSTGTGVAVEGAAATLTACKVHDCAAHGVAAFGAMDAPSLDASASLRLLDSEVASNKLSGVLVRTGAAVALRSSRVQGNGQWGLSLQDADASSSIEGSAIRGNGRGAVQVVASFDLDASLEGLGLAGGNRLEGAVRTGRA